MTGAAGDILNWAAAGLLFPLMALPAAAFVARPMRATAVFALLVAAIAGCGWVFALLAPDLAPTLAPRAAITFFVLLLLVVVAVAALGGPRRAAARIAPFCAATAKGAGRVVMWAVLVMALVQFSSVLMRYVFGVSFIAMQEGVTYLHGAAFLLAAGYALLTDDHVRVDIFYRGAPARTKALIDFLGVHILLFPTVLLILWTASPYVGNSWAVLEGSNEQSGLQALFVLKSFIPAFAALVALAGFSLAERAGRTLRGDG